MPNLADGNEPLKLTSLEVENILRLKACHLTMGDDGALIVEGANEAGKTSVLQSLEILLAGMSKTPDDPIHGDAAKGKIVGKFGDLVVTKTFGRGKRPALKIASAGARYGSPQKMLDSLLDHVALDPLRFMSQPPLDQVKTLADLMGVDTREIDARHEGAYADRRDANRDVRDLAGALAKISVPEDTPEEEISVSELMKQLDEVRAHNAHGAELEREKDRVGAVVFEAIEEVQAAEKEVADAQAALQAARNHLERAKAAASEAEAAAIAFEPQDEDEIVGQLNQADEVNAKVRDRRQAAEISEKLAKAQKIADAADETLKAIEAEREKLMTSARERLPVEDLTLTDDGVYYKGKPLAQAGSSAQLRVSVAVAMALNKDKRIRLLLIDDAEKLDAGNTRLVLQMAQDAGFQVLMARVGDGKDAAVLIEDGVVTND